MAALIGRARRVVVGMSGGVDSTVSALLLRQRGFEVVGVFMRNWDGRDETGFCSADRECEEAERVASRLGIQFHTVDLVKQYWTEVFQEMVEGYKLGLTPNPDVLCNAKVKFTHFFNHAINDIGCDAIATGHYARNSFGEDLERSEEMVRACLLKAVDRTKDQTFFLSQMPQKALRKTLFPVGELTKPVVKEIARQAGFGEIADKKESMGICFVGKKVAPGAGASRSSSRSTWTTGREGSSTRTPAWRWAGTPGCTSGPSARGARSTGTTRPTSCPPRTPRRTTSWWCGTRTTPPSTRRPSTRGRPTGSPHRLTDSAPDPSAGCRSRKFNS